MVVIKQQVEVAEQALAEIQLVVEQVEVEEMDQLIQLQIHQ
jgi:hypothetical protein